MDRANYRAWMTSRFCVVVGGLFLLGALISSTYYDTFLFQKTIVCNGGTILFGKQQKINTHKKPSTWNSMSSSCKFDEEQFEGSHGKWRLSHGIDNIKTKWRFHHILPNVHKVTLEEAFFKRMRTIDVSQSLERLSINEVMEFKTRFLPNKNYMNFPLLAMENVCIDSTGALILINTTDEEVQANISGHAFIPELYYLWNDIYACNGNVSNDNCAGVMFSPSIPRNSTFLRGNTAHMLPYIGNSMHNWAERTWPYIMAYSPPFKFTIPFPIHNYIIHRFDKWLWESKYATDREQLLWQLRMAMETSGSKNPTYLLVKNQTKPICLEHLILQQHARERIDETRLPLAIAGRGVKKYRDAIFAFFGMPKPQVRLPPKKLRVLFYGRNDTTRRRVTNQEEVITCLQNFSRPPLEVFVLDKMLGDGETNYTFQEVLRIFSQTDILVIAHGANTWATFLLPEGAGVVEIFGPCNWSSYNYTDLRIMHTWMHVNAAAANLKHNISNPFNEAIANPQRGNTTMCKDPYWEIPDYSVDIDKLKEVINSFGSPHGHDHLTQHWLYDWDSLGGTR